MSQLPSACEQFAGDLAAVLRESGDEINRHLDHLASCDHCRDLRFEAQALVQPLRVQGDRYQPPIDMLSRVRSRIAAQSPAVSDASRVATVAHASDETQRPNDARLAETPRAVVAPAGAHPRVAASATPRWSSRRRAAWLTGGAVVAAAGIWLVAAPSGEGSEQIRPRSLAMIDYIDHAAQGASGLAVSPETQGLRLQLGAHLPAGAEISTDAHTRVRLAVNEHMFTLNRTSHAKLPVYRSDALTLTSGQLSVETEHDVAVATPVGSIAFHAAYALISASEDKLVSIRVLRGGATVHIQASEALQIQPGEEAILQPGQAPRVTSAGDIASAIGWNQLGETGTSGVPSAGLGSLRAMKPGDTRDREQTLRLSRHKVDVKIAGSIARVEIEESFHNDSRDELEGVYQFPMPPDASIEALALDDQKGGFIEGAFVEKDRAGKIWRGVIRNATKRPAQTQEYIWVPGPWRDPALLEWQRGGRFELRIFPIPAGQARTVRITYTQPLAHAGDRLRFHYPLPESASKAAADQFSLQVQIADSDLTQRVHASGYRMVESRQGERRRLAIEESAFIPRGSLSVEFSPRARGELQAWAYRGNAVAVPAKLDPEIPHIAVQQALAQDARAYAMISIRPQLPRWQEFVARDYIFVVDSSQSMVGERFARARDLVATSIAHMDRRDRVSVLTCDVECTQQLSLVPATAQAAKASRAALALVQPAGSTDIERALRDAAGLAGERGRARVFLYVGDGFSSTGYRTRANIVVGLRELVAQQNLQISTIAIGADSDVQTLQDIARSGGGQALAYTPGHSTAIAALSVLESLYGTTLSNISIELPAGLEAAETEFANIKAGDAITLTGRLAAPIDGEVKLTGRIAGKPFEQRYPLRLQAMGDVSNAFVPRVWASHAIAHAESIGDAGATDRIVALSKGYRVLSKYTSLLALESQAMYSAFGIDTARPEISWSGEQVGHAAEADGVLEHALNDSGKLDTKDRKSGGFGGSDGLAQSPKPTAATAPSMNDIPDIANNMTPTKPTDRARVPNRAGWMKRVYRPAATLESYGGVTPEITQAIAQYRAALQQQPDSRERHRKLVQGLSYSGALDEAYEVAQRWLSRDALDPEGLIYMADIVGRKGDRKAALRLLSGIVDVQPERAELQLRLAQAYEQVGAVASACSHRVSHAELVRTQAAIASALRCMRTAGREAQGLLALLPASEHPSVLALANAAAPAAVGKGPFTVEASWDAPVDLDISVISPQGTRISALGGRAGAVVRDAASQGHEQLLLGDAPRGRYLIEVSRVRATDRVPVSGTIKLRAHGSERSFPFTLSDARSTIAYARVVLVDELVAVNLQARLSQVTGSGAVDSAKATLILQRVGQGAINCLQQQQQAVAGSVRVRATLNPDATSQIQVTSGPAAGRACIDRVLRSMRIGVPLPSTVSGTITFSD